MYSTVCTKNCINLFRNTTGNLSNLASQIFQDNTGHNILDLFNNVLTEKGPGTHFLPKFVSKIRDYLSRKKTDLEQLVRENGVINLSHGLPGLIIQSYLIIVKLFELDVMEPVDFVTKIENSTNDQVVEINTQEAESGRVSSPILLHCDVQIRVFFCLATYSQN